MEPPGRARPEPAHRARTVVVGYDGSGLARAAFRYAARGLAPPGRLIAVHAIAPPSEFIDTPPYEHRLEHERSKAREILDSLRSQPAGEAEVVTEIAVGEAATVLTAAAERHGAEEIVVGSRGAARVGTLLGSVAHDLVHEAQRPIVVVPREAVEQGLTREPHAEAHRVKRVTVVGYDGSASANAALSYAAWRTGGRGEIVAIYAFAPSLPAPVAGLPPAVGDTERHLQQHEQAGRAVLDAIPDEIRSECSLDQQVVQAPPEHALTRVAGERAADEIVVGSRGLGRVRGVLGSVSHELLRTADRPVVIVPERAVDRRAAEDVQELVE